MRSIAFCISVLRGHGITVGKVAASLGIDRHQLVRYSQGVKMPDDLRKRLDDMTTEINGPLVLPERHAETVTRRAAR